MPSLDTNSKYRAATNTIIKILKRRLKMVMSSKAEFVMFSKNSSFIEVLFALKVFKAYCSLPTMEHLSPQKRTRVSFSVFLLLKP